MATVLAFASFDQSCERLRLAPEGLCVTKIATRAGTLCAVG
jgi:hypothetical protein